MGARLAKHLLWRLRHQVQVDAVGAELLTERRAPVAGQWVSSFAPGPLGTGRSQAEIVRMLDRLGRSGSISRDDAPVVAVTNIDPEDRERIARKVVFVARSHCPIFGVSEDEDRLPASLRQAVRINLVCGALDMGNIRDVHARGAACRKTISRTTMSRC